MSQDRAVEERQAISSTAEKNSGGGTSAEDNPGLPGGIWYTTLDLTARGQRQIASTDGNDSAEQSCSTVKREEPSGIGKQNVIRRPTREGKSDQRLRITPGPKVARWLKQEGSAEKDMWLVIRRPGICVEEIGGRK